MDPNETIEINFNKKINKVQSLLNMWAQRNLSIKGKITIIKSVVLPQILYVCVNLGVPEWFVTKMNTIMYHFIWSARMDKVKRATLINKIEKGGLKMIDLETMIQSQRIIWIKRFFKLTNDASWTFYMQYKCSKIGIQPKDLLKCNLNPENLCITWPLFYHQMLFSWFHFKADTSMLSPWNIRRNTIVFNKDILIGNQYARNPFLRWFHKGIKQIHDIYDKKGNLHPISYLEEQYSVRIDILSYNSLVSAIPSSWKNEIKKITIEYNAISFNELPHFDSNGKAIPITLMNNKSVYWKLVKNITQKTISLSAWDQIFNEEDNNWQCIFKVPYEVTFETQIQSFYYKTILRIFPCNWYISKFDPSVTQHCQFCQGNIDDIPHYFYDCDLCLNLWSEIKQWIHRMLNIGNIDMYINKKKCYPWSMSKC